MSKTDREEKGKMYCPPVAFSWQTIVAGFVLAVILVLTGCSTHGGKVKKQMAQEALTGQQIWNEYVAACLERARNPGFAPCPTFPLPPGQFVTYAEADPESVFPEPVRRVLQGMRIAGEAFIVPAAGALLAREAAK
jgi:hypothetical protein